jgi:hypothetical protein
VLLAVVLLEGASRLAFHIGVGSIVAAALLDLRWAAWVGVVLISSRLAIEITSRALLARSIDESGNIRLNRRAVAAAGPRLAGMVAMLSGVYAAALGVAAGPWIAVLGFVGLMVLDLALGIGGYRAGMRRPWPDVAPLEDDDDW